MSATSRTPDQVLADDVAMAVFRRCQFNQYQVKKGDLIEEPVSTVMAGYSTRTVARIACAFPEAFISLQGGTASCDEWLCYIATQVVVLRLQFIVGDRPRFGERYSGHGWTFLGGDRRDLEALPLGSAEKAADNEYVDYWGNCYDLEVVVVYGRGRRDYVQRHVTESDTSGRHAREAIRRLHNCPPPAPWDVDSIL